MLTPDEHALFGRFPHDDLSLGAMEALLIQRWPQKERFREPQLMGSKWWDTRSLHPVQATYLFSHLLTQKTREIIRGHLDDSAPREAQNGATVDWNPIKAGDVFAPPIRLQSRAYWERKVLGLIRARQQADEDGIPYALFIAEGLKHFYFGAGTYVLHRGNGKIVEPNLLYGEDCLAQIRRAWLEQIKTRVQHATHPRYRVEHRDAHPDHLKHTHWIIQQLEIRPVREYAAARLVKAGILRLDEALPRVQNQAQLRKLIGE